jgi:hypothetical protein
MTSDQDLSTITTPKAEEEAQDIDAKSTMNTETRRVSDWSWTNVQKAYQDFWKRQLRVANNAKGGAKLAL